MYESNASPPEIHTDTDTLRHTPKHSQTHPEIMLYYLSGHSLVQTNWCINLTMSLAAAAAAKSLQSYPTLCDPIDGSPPGSTIPGILQTRTLEWVAISFSSAWKWKVKVKSLSCVWLFATPWTAAYQAPPLMGFSKQEHWSGLPLPSLHISTTVYKTWISL